MRYFALVLAIVGAILIAAGAISFFAITHVMSGGITALFTLGGIALGLGLICAVISAAISRNEHRHNV